MPPPKLRIPLSASGYCSTSLFSSGLSRTVGKTATRKATSPTRPTLHQRRPRRTSRSVLVKTLLSIASVSAVKAEEDVFEVGLVAVECEHVEAGECLDERVCGALEAEDDPVPSAAELRDTRNARESIAWRRSVERHLHARERPGAEGLDRLDQLQPSVLDEADSIRDVLA